MFVAMILILSASTEFAQSGNDSSRRQARAAAKKLQIGKSLAASRITPHTEKYVLYTQSSDGSTKQASTILTRTIEFGEQNGEPIIRVVQRYDRASGTGVDTSTLRRRTLEPLSYNAELTEQKESFEFTAERARGSITTRKSGEIKSFDVPFKEPVMNAVVQNEIIQSLPLKNGYAVTIPLYNPGKIFLTPTYRVIGSERIPTADGQRIEAWLIEVEGAAVPTTIWVSKQTQQLLMQKSLLKNGSEFWKVRLYS